MTIYFDKKNYLWEMSEYNHDELIHSLTSFENFMEIIDEETGFNDKTYEMQLAHIAEDQINYSDSEKQAIAIFTKMNSAYALSTVKTL